MRARGLQLHVFPTLRAVAILRNPRERTVSAFNDYVRMGRIRGQNATANGMDAIVRQKLVPRRVARKVRHLRDGEERTTGEVECVAARYASTSGGA